MYVSVGTRGEGWVQDGGYGWYKRGRVGTRGGEVEVILT